MTKIKALPGRVLVDEIRHGERVVGGIILLNDDGKSSGVRNRWCHVYAVGAGVTDIEPGDWILVVHARWTRGVKYDEDLTLWGVEWPESVLAVSDRPYETFAQDSIVEAEQLHR